MKAHIDVEAIAGFIMSVQKENGEIPWSRGGKTDPWDHVESAMGLTVAGYLVEAKRAYEWMRETQLDDGSWWSEYRDGEPVSMTKESNFSSYIAVGVFHYYLRTKDVSFLRHMWPTVKSGLDYAVSLQAPTGEIYWAKNLEGVVDTMALLTGSSSVYMSLKCGMAISSILEEEELDWGIALKRLGHAIQNKPSLFNMKKSRHSMDWFYPVLCGAVTGTDAHGHIDKCWQKFVVPGWGVRCVSDRPWVTMAETSELILALVAIGEYEKAKNIFNWIKDKKYEDGSYWTGVTFPDWVIWPDEITSWTSAVVLLAYDALNNLTEASCLFTHDFWDSNGFRNGSVSS
jgi:hypothetical protein